MTANLIFTTGTFGGAVAFGRHFQAYRTIRCALVFVVVTTAGHRIATVLRHTIPFVAVVTTIVVSVASQYIRNTMTVIAFHVVIRTLFRIYTIKFNLKFERNKRQK